MLKHKQAHGAGYMPTFPSDHEIAEAMEGCNDDYMVPAYGDGSQTTPSNWWAALGGYVLGFQAGIYRDRTSRRDLNKTYADRQLAKLARRPGTN